MPFLHGIGWILVGLAGIGILYTLVAASLLGRLFRPFSSGPAKAEAVSLLKPLYGAEPRLAANLATFLDQDWDVPVQMVAGVQRQDDPAIAIVAGMDRREIDLIVDSTRHGANAKVANLLNMAPAARHDLIVLSDSDMAVPPNYLATLATALAAPGVGAATCLYRGRGDGGAWSVIAAAGISYQFIPQLAIGLGIGLARPGMGSTIALRRATLDAIGGFRRFADSLADDYELCAAVRGLGLSVVVPPILLVHGCAERSLGDVWRHELRWAATIRTIDRGGYAGTILTHPLPLALLALPFAPATGAGMAVAALAARLLFKIRFDAIAGAASAPSWMLPVRDILSFVVFVASFLVRSVDWRGERLKMEQHGRIVRPSEMPVR
ncbi:bacteriohopanetetrol glucosamine biosynthesis glycosyltransferase HpnI [Sphingomonas sp.]|uniref:bacteriohopanetetrol glucosamine biosynthesis glycosyltransferase HpnI n=1 Tax=Sphingomonas sp. TaxID=28214 RepID=UPI000DB141F9|nr:bacteriohopanetetrol glucosamine biosynthesis glycosyltransferase HpnI [Sphingomonas sp.]PZU06230.1 MAG: hopanoid biosynthesis associated glycosyl transferase HpnI [Sphingomonas sp.]